MKIYHITCIQLIAAFFIAIPGRGQSSDYDHWHLMDYFEDNVPGISLEKAMNLLVDHEPAQKVRVAVIDCGVDVGHPALVNSIYVNSDEIENNGVDDDGNGFVDDIRGWNFLVDSTGNRINHARYEAPYFFYLHDSLTKNNLPMPKWLAEMDLYLLEDLTEDFEFQKLENEYYAQFYLDYVNPYMDLFGEYPDGYQQILSARKALGFNRDERRILKELIKLGLEPLNYFGYVVDSWWYDQYWLNPNFNPRDPQEPDHYYGNNEVDGGMEPHGTHISGIIAAAPTPESSMKGIAHDLVEIIPIRAVPDGDEIDKDVANSIRYAVDQGAHIINMSFGKHVSSDPQRVWDALLYAAAHDVLIVHAAGNEAQNIDAWPFYPNPGPYQDIDSVFINVGSSTIAYNQYLISEFSNYGKRNVHLFAPGENILSLGATHDYKKLDGTSMAAPMVSGVAALLLAYFPEFTATEIKQILLNNTFQPSVNILPPDAVMAEWRMQPMSQFCASGGIVNAHFAVKHALNMNPQLQNSQ